MRNIAHFTGADITGVTINQHQVRVANQYFEQKGTEKQCRAVQGDFHELRDMFQPESFDAAYAIEATCHSPDRKKCFTEIYHCLKKGGVLAAYDWAVLPERGYDSANPDHLRIKEGIEVGNGLPTLATTQEIADALTDAGFEIVDLFDANRNVHSGHEVPWYSTLTSLSGVKGFRMSRIGRSCTHAIVVALEFLRIAPKGSVRVSSLLNATALDYLVEGGKKEIFTPSLFFLAKKK